MLKVAVSTLAAAAFIAMTLVPNTADAAKRRYHDHARQHVAVVVPPPGPYYGLPGSYYPAPPFPFFLIPGPWWIPGAHP
jgi:hypothetical protein